MRINLGGTALTVLIAVVLLLPIGQSQASSKARLVLSVRKPDDKTREIIPGSKLYAAELFNKGDETLELQAIQMPGGYAGSGKFFACGLQAWKKGKWVRLWSDQTPTNLVGVELKPGDHREVCTMLLPSQAGSVGQCVRFKLSTRWRSASSYTVSSEPFVIGDGSTSDGPCRRSNSSIPAAR